MAHVTRCPYCSSIWLLPNKEIAEKGPVKCSRCSHSFDAMACILEVPDKLFPGYKQTPYQETLPAENADSQSTTVENNARENPPIAQTSVAIKPVVDLIGRTEPSVGNFAKISKIHSRSDEELIDTNDDKVTEENPPSQKKADEQKKSTLAHIVPAGSGISIPENSSLRSPKRKSSIGSVVLILIMLTAILGVCSIAFNQQILEKFPYTKNFYSQACHKLPCPGFYLSNIEAFVVSKTNLIATGEPGNYNLEVTVVNGSTHAQAVPHLELQLVDDTDTLLQKTLISPEQFLVNANTTKSVSSGRALNVRISIQTNVTPSRCVVIPVYP